ncbi:hypothetical protein IFM89_018827 [Coptis chinensis]|uniref:Uncharacterized protein n=1 Tax=Coptis chinensis TaxID=261450 RepID=A0A835GWZ4_9MAGN|nr:hypothetical protein IFM89_018827 [Coptis chinensis]
MISIEEVHRSSLFLGMFAVCMLVQRGEGRGKTIEMYTITPTPTSSISNPLFNHRRLINHSFPLSISPTINQRRKILLLNRSSKTWIRGSLSNDNVNANNEEECSKCRVDRERKVEVLVAAAATVILGVGNRVLYKLALVPLKHYPFFLAQLATFGYVLVYFSILYFRYHVGIVTDEMLSMPKAPFLAVGLLEALAAASGMAAGAILSGTSIPILSQTFLVWQLLLSAIFLGRRYRPNQIFGCLLVAIGVVITVASGSSGGLSLKDAGVFWTLLMITSFFLQAGDTVLKEIIFLDAARHLKGGSVDLFVLNSYGSAFQLWGVPFSQLPSYLKDGAACFLNIDFLSKGCQGAPILPLLFIIVNMAYNISLLHLLKISSAVVSCLASTFSVPLSVYVFTLPLPYIGVASSLPAGFVSGVVVLVAGLLVYAWTPPVSTNSLDHQIT